MQQLNKFKLPKNFRGKPAFYVQLWWLVQSTIFKMSPQFMYGFRVKILKIFGARIGKNVIIRPSAIFTYPWKISIGDNSWIGDGVILYSLGEIFIGKNTVVSQYSHICAGDHDLGSVDFSIRARNIFIGSGVWIGSDVFVAPGVTVADEVVVGARSSVFGDLKTGYICFGTPCREIKKRIMNN